MDQGMACWLESALAAHSELVLTGAQLHHGADFWTCGSLAVPISAMPPLTATGNRLKRVVEVTAFHNTEHDLMFEQAAWYETQDPSLNGDYPDLRLRGSFWVTHAWLDQHHPGWESRLLVATALDMPIAELLSSVFSVDFPGATSLPHAKATVELPHTELGQRMAKPALTNPDNIPSTGKDCA